MQNNELSQQELKNTEQVLKSIEDSVGQGEIENIDPQVFADMVLRQTRANMVMRDVNAETNTTLVGSPGSTIDYREIGALEVREKAEFEKTDTQTLEFPAVRVEMYPTRQTIVPLSDEAMEDANLDTAEAVAEEIGEALAQKNDEDAYDLITDESYVLDDKKYDGTETLGDNAFEQVLETDGTITFEDVNSLAGQMRQEDLNVDSLVISEDHAHELINQELFHLANERGDQVGRTEGRIGRISRMDVYVTSKANPSTVADDDIQAVMLDSDRAFVEAVKRQPRMEMDRDQQRGFDAIIGTMRYGHEVYDASAVGYLRNSGA